MSKAIRHFRNEWELELKCLPQFFLGLLEDTPVSLVTPPVSLIKAPKVFAKVNSTKPPSRF